MPRAAALIRNEWTGGDNAYVSWRQLGPHPIAALKSSSKRLLQNLLQSLVSEEVFSSGALKREYCAQLNSRAILPMARQFFRFGSGA